MGVLTFFFGGWKIAWGASDIVFNYVNRVGLQGDGLIFAINGKYYGLVNTHRMFDYPFFAWILFFGSIAFFVIAIRSLFKGR